MHYRTGTSHTYVYVTQHHAHDGRSLFARLGDDAIIWKVRNDDKRANDEHIIITVRATRSIPFRKRLGNPTLHVILRTHTRTSSPPRRRTRRHSIVIIYHYAREKTRPINPRCVQPRYHWFMHCDVRTAVKRDLSRALCRVTASEIMRARAHELSETRWKKMSTFTAIVPYVTLPLLKYPTRYDRHTSK